MNQSTQKSGWLIYKRLISIALKDNATPVTIAIFGMIITALSDPALSAIMKPILDGGFIERDQSVISLLPLGLFSIFFIILFFLEYVSISYSDNPIFFNSNNCSKVN